MGRGRERVFKGKSTFVKIQGDILWAGRHKLFKFWCFFTFIQLLAGEEFRTLPPMGQSQYSDPHASKYNIILWLSLILLVFEWPLPKGRRFWRFVVLWRRNKQCWEVAAWVEGQQVSVSCRKQGKISGWTKVAAEGRIVNMLTDIGQESEPKAGTWIDSGAAGRRPSSE